MKKFYILAATAIVVLLLIGASYVQLTPEGTAGHVNAGERGGSEPPFFEAIDDGAVVHAHIQAGRDPLYSTEKPQQDSETKQQLEESNSAETERQFTFESVNGITLWDSKEQVLEKLGVPEAIVQDEFFADTEVLYYPGMEIGIERDMVRYVAVNPEAGTLWLDDRELEMTPDAFEEAMGQPDFVAEDGLVYQQGQYAIKLYLNSDETVRVIRFFHTSST